MGFTGGNLRIQQGNSKGGSSTPVYTLPVITQTLDDGTNAVALGASYNVKDINIQTSAGANIEGWEWNLEGGTNPTTQVNIVMTLVDAYTDAKIYVEVY